MKLSNALTHAFAALATAKKPDKSNECAVSDGSVHGVAYRYYSNGPKCARNSEVGSIEGSIYHNLLRLDATEFPDCRCVKYDRGGAWEGWLLYGALGKVDLAGYCGPTIDGRLEWDCQSMLREL